ncbi:MAG: 2-oxo acid dehydrogenase subunit E2 [Acutalibacteraceae bacterium]|jgi:pyruvate/2-oxoglutarate dehydrogenase complex dihydrolipoamide acyltransferase (E2) component
MRADGKRLKNIDPMYAVAAHIMDKRVDAMNMITIDTPYDEMHEYIIKKRKEGIALSHMSIIIAAYLRTAAEFPELNRFVVNKRIYARNDFAISMVVLTEGGGGHGTMAKMFFKNTDTVFEVNQKINDFIEANRTAPENNGTEKMIKILLSVPGILTVGVKLFKIMDKYGLLPKKLIDISPFHNSLVISNLISIRTNHIYHHCYEFGTTGLMVTMGNLREVPVRKGDQIVFKRSLPLGVVMDERICSGVYFAQAFRTMRKYLKDPSLLEVPPERVLKDPAL